MKSKRSKHFYFPIETNFALVEWTSKLTYRKHSSGSCEHTKVGLPKLIEPVIDTCVTRLRTFSHNCQGVVERHWIAYLVATEIFSFSLQTVLAWFHFLPIILCSLKKMKYCWYCQQMKIRKEMRTTYISYVHILVKSYLIAWCQPQKIFKIVIHLLKCANLESLEIWLSVFLH